MVNEHFKEQEGEGDRQKRCGDNIKGWIGLELHVGDSIMAVEISAWWGRIFDVPR